jgi:formiminoglutamase
LHNPDDPRLGDIIQPWKDDNEQLGAESRQEKEGGESTTSGSSTSSRSQLVLVGFPADEGVRRNGGRVGAAGGPAAMRRLMQRLGTVVNPEYGIDLKKISILDAGDVEIPDLETGHQNLTKRVSSLIRKGAIPFVIGGGNDQSYPNACALLENTQGDIGVVNIDAHLDVRPLKEGKVHSGSPFRLLLEDSRFNGRNFVEFAAQGNQCSATHADYVSSRGGRIIWLSTLLKNKECVAEQFEAVLAAFSSQCHSIFVSFDLDAVKSSDAPGVSAPGTVGLSAQDALEMCMCAGKNPKVRLFDLSEYNPAIEDYRTGRLVGTMFYYFALGIASRS